MCTDCNRSSVKENFQRCKQLIIRNGCTKAAEKQASRDLNGQVKNELGVCSQVRMWGLKCMACRWGWPLPGAAMAGSLLSHDPYGGHGWGSALLHVLTRTASASQDQKKLFPRVSTPHQALHSSMSLLCPLLTNWLGADCTWIFKSGHHRHRAAAEVCTRSWEIIKLAKSWRGITFKEDLFYHK